MDGHSNGDLTEFEMEKLIELGKRLKELINCHPNELDEGILAEQAIRVLRHKKFDVDATLELIKRGLTLQLADEVVKVPYEEYKRVYDSKIIAILKKGTADGSKIIWTRVQNWNTNDIDLMTYFAASFHYLDEALYSRESQEHGFSAIIDVSGVGIKKLAKILSFFTIDMIAQMFTFYQGAYPIKIKAIHYINVPYMLATFFAGCKYLMSKKMRQRLNLHKKGPEVLLEYFEKDVLPVSLNGLIPDEEAVDRKLLKAVEKKGMTGGSTILNYRKCFTIPN